MFVINKIGMRRCRDCGEVFPDLIAGGGYVYQETKRVDTTCPKCGSKNTHYSLKETIKDIKDKLS